MSTNQDNFSMHDQSAADLKPELELRSRIDAVQERASVIVDETYEIRADTNDNIHRLGQLRRVRSDLEQNLGSLSNKMVGLKKMEKKKKHEIRIHNKKIRTLEERFQSREGQQREKERNQKYLEGVRSQKSIHKNGYVSTELIRLKRKLDHEIIMDGIRNDRHSKFVKTKVEQEEQREAIDRRRLEIVEENRKKMLEVQFHVKIAKLSMQRYKEKISEKTNTRVKMERWEQARMTKIADQKIKLLKQITDEQEQIYNQSKMEEEYLKKQKEQMLDRSYEEHKIKIESMKSQSQLNRSRHANASSLTHLKSHEKSQEDELKLAESIANGTDEKNHAGKKEENSKLSPTKSSRGNLSSKKADGLVFNLGESAISAQGKESEQTTAQKLESQLKKNREELEKSKKERAQRLEEEENLINARIESEKIELEAEIKRVKKEKEEREKELKQLRKVVEADRKKKEEEAEKKRIEQVAEAKRIEEEKQAKRKEQEERRRKEAEDQTKKVENEETQKKKVEVDATKKKEQEEENKKKAEADEKKKKADEAEKKKKEKTDEEAKKKTEAEAVKKGASTSEVKTVEPIKPAETTKPAQITKPAEATKPAEPIKPAETTKPAQITKPAEPIKPATRPEDDDF